MSERFVYAAASLSKGKTWLIINHEFMKEAKTTAARFEKLKFRVYSLCGKNA